MAACPAWLGFYDSCVKGQAPPPSLSIPKGDLEVLVMGLREKKKGRSLFL
jgi:hypothetical protein